MRVGVAVFRPDSLTYTISRAVSAGAHEVFVYGIEKAKRGKSDTLIADRLLKTPGVSLVEEPETVSSLKLDWLIYQLHSRMVDKGGKSFPTFGNVSNVVMISTGDRKCAYVAAIRNQIREAIRFGPIVRDAVRILYKDGFYRFDLFGFNKPRSVIGFDPHSQYLCDDERYNYLFSFNWKVVGRRPIRLNFMGSQQPARRSWILDEVRPLVGGRLGYDDPRRACGGSTRNVYWHEYSDSAGSGLGYREFVDVLTNSDFTLCPPGYSLVTHRPIESLLRGSVPVLNAEELAMYDIGLRDGYNCLAVHGKDWAGTVERLLAFDEEQMTEMRRNIKCMEKEYLRYEATARHIRARIGLE